jgi:hypothetical protein
LQRRKSAASCHSCRYHHNLRQRRHLLSVLVSRESDALESASARRTNYNLVEVSRGTIRGLVPGADPQDKLRIRHAET